MMAALSSWQRGRHDVAGSYLADPAPNLLTATILRHRRGWQVMWIGTGKSFRDFRAATLTAAVTGASTMAAEFCRANPAGAATEFLLLIFGRRRPVFEGPQLLVTGEPGQFTATDARDNSVYSGATLEDLLAVAGVNPAQPGDYAINWIRPISAILPDS
jgi:hypothetical protein